MLSSTAQPSQRNLVTYGSLSDTSSSPSSSLDLFISEDGRSGTGKGSDPSFSKSFHSNGADVEVLSATAIKTPTRIGSSSFSENTPVQQFQADKSSKVDKTLRRYHPQKPQQISGQDLASQKVKKSNATVIDLTSDDDEIFISQDTDRRLLVNEALNNPAKGLAAASITASSSPGSASNHASLNKGLMQNRFVLHHKEILSQVQKAPFTAHGETEVGNSSKISFLIAQPKRRYEERVEDLRPYKKSRPNPKENQSSERSFVSLLDDEGVDDIISVSSTSEDGTNTGLEIDREIINISDDDSGDEGMFVFAGSTAVTRLKGTGKLKLKQIKPKKTQRTWKSQNAEVLQHKEDTVVTAHVAKVVGPMLGPRVVTIDSGKMDVSSFGEGTCMQFLRKAKSDKISACQVDRSPMPKSIHWLGSPMSFDGLENRIVYDSASICGEIYSPNDCFASYPRAAAGGVDNSLDQSGSHDMEQSPRYGRIVYLFESTNNLGQPEHKMAHIQIFRHGTETAIGEFSHAHELFLTDLCEDIPLSKVDGKIIVDFQGQDLIAKRSGLGEVTGPFLTNNFYYRLQVSEVSFGNLNYGNKFIAAPLPESAPGRTRCQNCDFQKSETRRRVTRIETPRNSYGPLETFHHNGNSYHLHDFVQIVPSDYRRGQKLYLALIGQIIKITTENKRYYGSGNTVKTVSDIRLKVQLYGRHDNLLPNIQEGMAAGNRIVRDNRRLYRRMQYISTTPDRLDGQVRVRHQEHIKDIDEFKDNDDKFLPTFWVNQQLREGLGARLEDLQPLPSHEMLYSAKTEEAFQDFKRREKIYAHSGAVERLIGMDLFGGCGGLTLAFHSDGAITTSYSIDFSVASCRTLRKNMPKVHILNQDISLLLRRRLALDRGEVLEPLRDCEGREMPDLPVKGTISIIFGGPVCDGLSGLNRNRKWDDIKNSLMAAFLAYVDYYRPDYVFIENLGPTIHEKNRSTGLVKQGIIKLTLAILTSLGYQVHYKILQVGQFGVPQSRSRFVLWATTPGLVLPRFPEPTHEFDGRCKYGTKKTVPYAKVTVDHALSDLWHNPFEWENPAQIICRSDQQKTEDEARARTIPQVHFRPGDRYLGENRQQYKSQPLYNYQRQLRKGVKRNTLLNHVTKAYVDHARFDDARDTYSRITNERVHWIGFGNEADLSNAPIKLWPYFIVKNNKLISRRYSRSQPEGYFSCCLGVLDPCTVEKSIHPFFHRTLTIREFARAQGYPDWFEFLVDDDDISINDITMMIGNSVPAVGFGYAIFRELYKVEIDRFFKGHPNHPDDKHDDMGPAPVASSNTADRKVVITID
ncbi:hypothetical protein BP6252_06386 [Coleophoma cylindrospora]|uniref:DNA (cytosine-5-)-methyltransferase n=1 Tax=Coleophoma cylindrospora TaxID=1849047 RepID=A0A3D8RMV8_9HELO|nr:hypothetical protein BP6252_06386 [Coleophoma cylindrospora]